MADYGYSGEPRRFGPSGFRREPALILILSIITCGLYYLWWMYAVSQEVQDFLQEADTSPGIDVLATVCTCGLYILYWDYRLGKKIVRMQEMVGLLQVDNYTLYLILDIMQLGIITPLFEQGHLNDIWRAANPDGRYI